MTQLEELFQDLKGSNTLTEVMWDVCKKVEELPTHMYISTVHYTYVLQDLKRRTLEVNHAVITTLSELTELELSDIRSITLWFPSYVATAIDDAFGFYFMPILRNPPFNTEGHK